MSAIAVAGKFGLPILGSLTLILGGVSVYFCNLAIGTQRKQFLADNPDLASPEPVDIPLAETPWVNTQPFEDIELKSYDGLLLHGYYLPAKVPTTKTALLAHGYTGYAKGDMGLIAQMYHEQLGFNVLMPDDRGHGRSEGSYVGFGWHDRLDFLQWIQYLLQRVGEQAQIVLHGISMGGATVLMVSGEKLPEQVKCIVSDCAYTSARDILIYQLRDRYKLPPFPLYYSASLICKLRAGYFFGEASALEQVKKNTRPILFIHGEEDTFVPTKMLYPLYAACTAYKEKWLVAGAAHGLSYPTDPEGYAKHVRAFVAKFVAP